MRDYGKLDQPTGAMVSKQDADYRKGTPDERCGLCTMFMPPNGCSYVEGHIRPYDVCDFFERK
jgi:hypothetical protein